MSDYVFSSCQQLKLFLADKITSIYQESTPKVFEYHGDWSSLAVSQQHYNGFLPFENERLSQTLCNCLHVSKLQLHKIRDGLEI